MENFSVKVRNCGQVPAASFPPDNNNYDSYITALADSSQYYYIRTTGHKLNAATLYMTYLLRE